MAARRARSSRRAPVRKAVRRPPAARRKAKAPARKKVEAVPRAYGTATAHLIVSPCAEALEYYRKAFGATVLSTMPGPGGLMMHAEMKIGDSIVMLADEMPPMQGQALPRKSPRSAGATTGGVMLYVPDTDAVFAAAVAAGGAASMAPADMFWGDRYAQVEDPFGHVWAIATHLREVSPEEMMKAMAAMGPPPG